MTTETTTTAQSPPTAPPTARPTAIAPRPGRGGLRVSERIAVTPQRRPRRHATPLVVRFTPGDVAAATGARS